MSSIFFDVINGNSVIDSITFAEKLLIPHSVLLDVCKNNPELLDNDCQKFDYLIGEQQRYGYYLNAYACEKIKSSIVNHGAQSQLQGVYQ